MSANGKTLVIRNGTLIDGTGEPASQNDAVVIQGNRFSSVGPLPPGLNPEDAGKVEVIDAQGKWIMPGLIDGHCHLSFGFPSVSSVKYPSGRGTTSPGFSAIRAARNAQTVFCAPASPAYPSPEAPGSSKWAFATPSTPGWSRARASLPPDASS